MSFRDLWDIKHRNFWILGVPAGEEREKGAESICEDILAEHFANLEKEIGNPGTGTQSPKQKDHTKTHCN